MTNKAIELFPAFTYRFKILPFLKQRVLPLYEETLKKQSHMLLLDEMQHMYLKMFAEFLYNFFGKTFDVSKEISIFSSTVLFETLHRCVTRCESIFYDLKVSDIKKEHILQQFSPCWKKAVNFLLS